MLSFDNPLLSCHMLHIEKNYPASSTICKKTQVDIFKITPTGRSKKQGIKKPLCNIDLSVIIRFLEIVHDTFSHHSI